MAPRAVGLVRVSDVAGRDDLASPEIQRRAIADHAARRGYEVTEFLEGLDESGSRKRSAWWARLDQAIERVEAGDVEAVVVWKFSRAARHRLKWAVAIDRVESAGGRLESATEDFDTTTSAGRFARGMLGELNAFEAERIGEGWKEAHDARVRSGRPATGKPKWGYVYDPVEKLHKPDPVTGLVLADLYARFVAGESMYALVTWLNARGHRPSPGSLWDRSALRRVLDAGFGSGQFIRHGQLVAGVHEPVIDADLWQAYLDARATRRGRPPRVDRSKYVLAGLVRCGGCGGPMTAAQYGGRPLYRCETRYRRGLDHCETKYVRVEVVEAGVLGWLQVLADEVSRAADGVSVAKVRRATREQEAARLEREVLRCQGALTRLAVQNATTPLPPGVYEAAVADLSTELQGLEAAAEDAARTARGSVSEPGRVAAGLVDGWERWPVERRRETLRGLVRRVEVSVVDGVVGVAVVEAWGP